MPLFDDQLGALMRPQQGRNRRISSNEQPNWNDGNFDMTRLAPGQVFELPLIQGPGVINHIWMTSHAGGVGELNAITLRIYWDGSDTPGVEAPLGEFFAVGQGRPAVVESFPVQVSPTGSLSCYWRMPFAKSARIVISNDNPNRSSGLYWQVDYVELPELPPDTPYFYAKYRQEYPAAMGRDYLIADLEGKGHFVGAVMSVTMGQDGWFGEGDDFFYIDAEEIPSPQGTGSEDYFNDAWGFRPRTSAWFGQPRWSGWSAGDEGVCYRWHVLDPVVFQKSLKVTMEHKGNRHLSEEAWFIERPDFFNSVAFWYQTGAPKPFGDLPGFPERSVPWILNHLVKTFRQAEATGGAELAVQTTGFFGGRPALFWPNENSEGRLTLPFMVEEDGRYAARLVALKSSGNGAYDIEIDGAVTKSAEFHSEEEDDEADLLLGTFEWSVGEHTLSFKPSAGRRLGPLSVEMLRLLKLPPEANREVKNDNEAHFFRLGIGRAVYAYKLAYDDLPDSLQTLIDVGMMDPMYLNDENGHPINAWREGDRFHAESTAPNGWKHSWLGADARR